MQIIITGGAGFLGQQLASALVDGNYKFSELLLVDQVMPANPTNDQRIICRQMDLTEEGTIKSIISPATDILFHLAAVVSSQAERDFDLGWKVNLDLTRQLLETCRHQNTGIRFVFASSLAVYGGLLPETVDDTTALTPLSSYGTQKAMGELLVNDYSRKKFVDGRVLRLPTVCVRPGRPNQAASSFVSSIIREPLNDEEALCPVSPELALWLSSPDTVIQNIIHGALLDASSFGAWRSVNLPGIRVTVKDMLGALGKVAGIKALDKIQFKPDPAINNIVSSWPGRIDNAPALRLGFKVDHQFEDFIRQFIQSSKVRP